MARQDDEDVDFEEDEYYRNPSRGEPARGTLSVSVDGTLTKSLNKSLERSLGASADGSTEPNEVQRVVAGFRAVLPVTDHVVRVPVFLRRSAADEPPLLVLELNASPPYPTRPPVMRVVTKATWIETEDIDRLLGE